MCFALKRFSGLDKLAAMAVVKDIEMEAAPVDTQSVSSQLHQKLQNTHDLSSSHERCLVALTFVGAVECVPVGLVVLDDAAVLGPAVCASRGDGSAHLSVPRSLQLLPYALGCVWLGAIAVSVAPGTAPAARWAAV